MVGKPEVGAMRLVEAFTLEVCTGGHAVGWRPDGYKAERFRECGHWNPLDARFCGDCGRRLRTPAAE